MIQELSNLKKSIEGKQFVAHANSILETEMATDKVFIPLYIIPELFNPKLNLIFMFGSV